MKGHTLEHHHAHKGRKHHAKGGMAEHGDAYTGDREYEEDLKSKPARRTPSNIDDEAEERKHGGKVRKARKHGGHVHHEKMHELKHAKHIGHVHGEHAHHHAGRKPRKSGGRTGSDKSPLSSAHAGTLPPHHKDADID